MAQWLGQLLGHFPGWLILIAIVLIIIIAMEYQLLQTGGSLIDVWRQTNGKK